jgi:hypothetical protein
MYGIKKDNEKEAHAPLLRRNKGYLLGDDFGVLKVLLLIIHKAFVR